MKLLLLVALLTAGTTAHSIRRRDLFQFHNMIKFMIPESYPLDKYNSDRCYCGFLGSDTHLDELNRCCETHDNCYDQVMNMENCRYLTDNPYTTSYSYSYSGNQITCSDENQPCEAFICKCDRQAAICFSKFLNNKGNKAFGFC